MDQKSDWGWSWVFLNWGEHSLDCIGYCQEKIQSLWPVHQLKTMDAMFVSLQKKTAKKINVSVVQFQ